MQTRQRLTIAVRSALRKQGDVPGSREPPRELVSYFSSLVQMLRCLPISSTLS